MDTSHSITIHKAFKFRIYPTVGQQAVLAQRFGACRYIWNHFLAERKAVYLLTGKSMSSATCCRLLTRLKQQQGREWLQAGYNQSYQQVLRDQDKAYSNFFRRVKQGGKFGFPRFKSRHGKQSMRFVLSDGLKIEGKRIKIPKMGNVKIRQHRELEGKPKSMTVSKTKCGHYYVSVLCEVDVVLPEPSGEVVGVDLGLSTFATLSDGSKIQAPKPYRRQQRRLRLLQRRVSRKRKGSANRRKANLRVTRLHERIANRRNDFLHKTSHALVKQYGHIGLEDLSVKGMQQGLRLGKSVGDAALGEFVRQLQYKGSWYGCEVVQVDRWFPSSKTCSVCGVINDSLELSDREWRCDCGVLHDRDVNAAINILNQSTARTVGIDAHGDTSSRGKDTRPGNPKVREQTVLPIKVA